MVKYYQISEKLILYMKPISAVNQALTILPTFDKKLWTTFITLSLLVNKLMLVALAPVLKSVAKASSNKSAALESMHGANETRRVAALKIFGMPVSIDPWELPI